MKKENYCTLTNEELVKTVNSIVSDLFKTGGKSWSLRVPVDFNRDPDVLISEMGKRLLKAYQEPSPPPIQSTDEAALQAYPDLNSPGTKLVVKALREAFVLGASHQARQQPVRKTLDEALRAVSLAKNYLRDKSQYASIMSVQVGRLIHVIECLTDSVYASNQAEQGWVDVTERLPENEQFVDTWNGKVNRRARFVLSAFYRHVDHIDSDRMLVVSYPDITHWRELPEAPKPTTNN